MKKGRFVKTAQITKRDQENYRKIFSEEKFGEIKKKNVSVVKKQK